MKKLFFCLFFICNFSFASILEIVVPVPPGGPVDNSARVLQSELLNRQNIKSVVVYKPGGDGQVASRYFLNNQANKILMVSTTTSLMLKLTNKALDYDPVNDFNIIGPVSTAPIVVAVKSDSKFNTLSELLNESRTRNVTCGAAGLYTTLYINYVIDLTDATNLTVATYKSTPQPLVDLIGGSIDCFVTAPAPVKDRPELKILRDDIKNKTIKFTSFTGITIGKGTQVEDLIKKALVELSSDKEYINSMETKGYSVPKVDFNYSKVIEDEYLFLERYSSKRKIINDVVK